MSRERRREMGGEEKHKQQDADLAPFRHELATLARSKRTRDTTFTPTVPCDWRPRTVVDPRGSGETFTDAGAWEFVVMLLESGHPIEVVELKQPPGRKGYVMKVDGAPGQPKTYSKLQLGSGRTLGRTFHDSTVPERRR